MSESSEVYERLRQLEQASHTLLFRVDVLEEANLNNRVLSLESLVSQMTKDAAKMEATGESIKEDVASMKSWGKGFMACLSAIVILMGVLPYIEELLK